MNLAEDVNWDEVIVFEKLTIHLEVGKTARRAAFVVSISRGGRYRRLHFGKQWFEQLFVECDRARGRGIRTAKLDLKGYATEGNAMLERVAYGSDP